MKYSQSFTVPFFSSLAVFSLFVSLSDVFFLSPWKYLLQSMNKKVYEMNCHKKEGRKKIRTLKDKGKVKVDDIHIAKIHTDSISMFRVQGSIINDPIAIMYLGHPLIENVERHAVEVVFYGKRLWSSSAFIYSYTVYTFKECSQDVKHFRLGLS